MNEFFLKILNMSISASCIILVVLFLRLLLKKAPKWINVLLWGIVAIRLICPFTIESAMSLMPSVDILPSTLTDVSQSTTVTSQDINNSSQTTNGTSQNVTDTSQNISGTPLIDEVHPQMNNSHTSVIQESTATSVKAESINYIQLFTSIFSKLWIIGAILMLTYSIISYIRIKKKIDTAVLLRDNIYQSEAVVSPFVLGIIQPKIYLPFNINEQNMTSIIAHEQAHIKRKDYLWKPIGFLLLTLHWFNPLVWLGYILLCRDIELACDEKAIKEMTIAQRADYSQALLTCSVNRRMIAACPIAFGEVNVKNRITSVLNYKKPTFWIILVAIIASVTVAICFLTNPVSKNKDNKKTTSENTTEEETENNNSNSSTEDVSKDIDALKAKFPTYFGLDTTNGLNVYIWQMAENSYSCGLLANSDIGPTLYEQLELQETPATLDEMCSIIAYYYPTGAKNHVTISPIVMPYSSYAYNIDSNYTSKIIALFWRNFEEMQPYVEEETSTSLTDNAVNASKYTNAEISQMYKEVLKSERSFISVEEGNKEVLLKDYNYYHGTYVENLLKIMFGFKDINEDGNFEVIVLLTTSEHYPGNYEKLILFYEDGEVYGYRLPDWVYFAGDKVLGWSEVIWDGSKSVGVYEGRILVEINDKRLNLTYIFEQEGSEEEKWLIENERINDEDKIMYIGAKYSSYIYPPDKYEERYEFNDINIEKNVR